MGDAELKADVLQLKEQVGILVQTLSTLSLQGGGRHPGSMNTMVRSPTIKFPTFDGTEIEDWLFKCTQFFSVSEIDDFMKVTYVAMHLESKALAWHQAFTKNRPLITPLGWEEYKNAIKDRFGNNNEDPMSELLLLKQTTSVQSYHDAFDILLSKLNLQSDYALSCFVTGLKPNIASMVRLLKPKTIPEAFGLARLQETALSLQATPNYKNNLATHNNSKPPLLPLPQNSFTQKTPFTPHKNPPLPKFRPFNAEMEERKSKGLCFYCDEKFTPQHVCKNKRQLFVLEEEAEGCEEREEEQEKEEEEPHIAQISIQALAGRSLCHTMRIPGQIGKRTLSILVDSGSSHNFLDAGITKRMGLQMDEIPNFNISMANGGKMMCSYAIHDLCWRIRNTNFQADFYVIPLENCDAILGIQWLGTLGPITWDFKNLTMEFIFQGRRHVLKGAQPTPMKLQKKIGKELKDAGQVALIQPNIPNVEFFALQLVQEEEESLAYIQALMKLFAGVFEEPKGLPPLREGHDHKIALQQEHIEHLQLVMDLMEKNNPYAKASKCCFGAERLEYLGHIITREGVATDPAKVAAVKGWLVLRTIKQLREFLGLTGYHIRFVKGYSLISKPMTNLLRKDAFGWNNEAQVAFEKLKGAMTSALVLAMPNFSQPFVIEINASDEGIGAVLMLELPPKAKIHHTSHISLLKKCYETTIEEPSFPAEPNASRKPEQILAKKVVKRGRVSTTKLLVKWNDFELEDATWEFLYDQLQTYQDLDPCGQGSFEGEGTDASQKIDLLENGANMPHSNLEGNNSYIERAGDQQMEGMDEHMKLTAGISTT